MRNSTFTPNVRGGKERVEEDLLTDELEYKQLTHSLIQDGFRLFVFEEKEEGVGLI